MSTADKPADIVTPPPKPQPFYAPRFWIGASLRAWGGLLARNHFDVSPSKWHIMVSIFAYAAGNSVLGLMEKALYASRIRRSRLAEPPLFILGHWRNGTTLLHELLLEDPRHSSPTTYACLAPHHFLLTEGIFGRWLRFLLPETRPMDNMRLTFEGPQEEEFALCNLGARSPYLTIAFPNRPPQDSAYLDLVGLSPAELARWRHTLNDFLLRVNYRDPRRIVLKSPPHTARVRVLLEMFPDARFVHIVRDPYTVFTSTVHLWKSLFNAHGLQVPRGEGLEAMVYDNYLRMFRRYEEDKGRIPPGRLHELRYEDLVADPVGQLRQTYDRLALGEFEPARAGVERYLEERKDYRTNRYRLSDEKRAEIGHRWGEIIERYGYAPAGAGV